MCFVDGLPRWASNFALTLATIGLMVLSQSPFDLGFLGPFALVPWLIATRRASPLGAAALGLCMGVLYAVVGASWLFAAFESQAVVGIHSVLGTLLVALWAKGFLFGVIGGLARGLQSGARGFRVVVPAVVVALAEDWISDSPNGLPLLLLGHSQASVSGVAQLAVVVGVPGISALLLAVNAAVAVAVCEGRGQRRHRRVAVAWVMAWFVTAMAGIPLARAFESDPSFEAKTFLVVQPNVARRWRWEPTYQAAILEQIADETTRAIEESGERPDLILWPENLLSVPLTQGDDLARRWQHNVDRWAVPLVSGLVRDVESDDADRDDVSAYENARYRSSAVWWSPIVGQVDAVDKVRAIPLIESSRSIWGQGLLALILGDADRGPRVEETRVARPLRGEFSLAPVLCFEVLFPGIVEQRRDAESVAIVNLADDSWVAGETADRQLIAAAAFRAIEQRLTLVRVSHAGLSVVIDRRGREIAALEPDRVGHLLVHVESRGGPSDREKGAILMLPMLGGCFAWFFWPIRRRVCVRLDRSCVQRFCAAPRSLASGRLLRPNRHSRSSRPSRSVRPCEMFPGCRRRR